MPGRGRFGGWVALVAIVGLAVLFVGLFSPEPASSEEKILQITPTSTPQPVTKTLYVWWGNTSGIEDGTQAHPYNTIGEALSVVDTGDAVLVAQGTYTETGTVSTNKAIALLGGFEPGGWARDVDLYTTTIRRSDPDGWTVHWYAGTLDGFTITGGPHLHYAMAVTGAGTAAVIVTHNTIRDNAGGGLYITAYSDSAIRIEANTIISNTGYDGAGIGLRLKGGTSIIGNYIAGNTSSTRGGGIYCYGGSTGPGPLARITGNTIIGNSADRGGGIYLDNAFGMDVAANTLVSNTARQGGALYDYGEYGQVRHIRSNLVQGNSAEEGGGFYLKDSSQPRVQANRIVSNSATFGGGLFVGYSSAPQLDANIILSNTATYGGGAYIWDLSRPSFTNNLFAHNGSTWGAGIFSQGSYPFLINNTLAQNEGEGVYLAHNLAATLTNNLIVSNTTGIVASFTITPTLTSNDIWGNTLADYSGIAPGTGDISQDPAFVDAGAGDYHLRPELSPCIDAGTEAGAPRTDMDGQPRPYDGNGDGIARTDIGADEYYWLIRHFPWIQK